MADYSLPVRVYYEDTDAAGVVYYANYLKFMERARTEYLRDLGFEQDELREHAGIQFVVRRAELDYLEPARFNEKLTVTASLTALKRASLRFGQEVFRAGEEDGRPLCRGGVDIACVDAVSMRPARIPESVMEVFQGVR